MKIKLYLLILVVINVKSFAQIKELDNFREQLTDYINYDQYTGYTSSEAETSKLNLDKSFRAFVLLKDFSFEMKPADFENLKRKANNNTAGYLYSFFELGRDYNNKTAINNTDYYIGFFGLKDYNSPNIISVFVQPYKVESENYMIYYYSMNNKGTYFIKRTINNEIVFESTAATARAPVVKFSKIDSKHYLIVEHMGDNGQRAMVIQNEHDKWHSVNAFKGASFNVEALDYSVKKEAGLRKYLWIASNQKITAKVKDGPFELSWVFLNQVTKELLYKRYNSIWTERKAVISKWTNFTYTIDDYFIGEDFK